MTKTGSPESLFLRSSNKGLVGGRGKQKRTKTLKKVLEGALRLKTAESQIWQSQGIWLALKPKVYKRKLSELMKKYIQTLNNEHLSKWYYSGKEESN